MLTDFQMPGTDSFTLAETIRKDPASASSTVVTLVSSGWPNDADRCRELGIAASIPKPIKSSELRAAILSALSVRVAARNKAVLDSLHLPRDVLERTGTQ